MRPSLVLLVFVGGGVGSVARYLLATTVQRNAPEGFPFGTFLVNLIGCFAIGVVGALGLERAALSPEARTFLMVGILGGFTTFSSFAWETLGLLSVSQANDENVVNPPSIPTMRNVRASGESAARSSPSAPTTPIAKHPIRFTRNVPNGKPSGAFRWTVVARR